MLTTTVSVGRWSRRVGGCRGGFGAGCRGAAGRRRRCGRALAVAAARRQDCGGCRAATERQDATTAVDRPLWPGLVFHDCDPPCGWSCCIRRNESAGTHSTFGERRAPWWCGGDAPPTTARLRWHRRATQRPPRHDARRGHRDARRGRSAATSADTARPRRATTAPSCAVVDSDKPASSAL